MIGTKVYTMGAIATQNDPLYEALNVGRKLLSSDQLERMGLESLETQVWIVMEKAACVGAWMQEGLCQNTNRYVHKAVKEFRPWRDKCSGW